ncbi:ComEC/Rec2 family competence protein [Anaerosinus massiliensis]|uniref:ComEC/Rec2 family competence protein n=1 Tax=Massilibacillus massiliensis TaxID=1806837 RepID=UPI000AE1E931|nr:ComEC/Rec2 family competence protein [Massilibacillus massiliensis]
MKKFIQFILVMMMMSFAVSMIGCGNRADKNVNAENSTNTAAKANTHLKIKMLDIGQGDAILIKTGEQVILIDTGDVDMRDKLVDLLKKEDIHRIDKLIISHPHADHLGGAYAVLKNFEVKQIYDNGQPTTTSTYRTYMKLINQKKIPYKQLLDSDNLDFGNGVSFKVFSPTASEIKTGGDLNNNSIVGKLTYQKFSMLFTGDCETEREKVILKKYGNQLKSTILKSPHHGSKTSSNRNYLKAIDPEAVLISCGKNNDYKHPHDVTLNKYEDLKLNIYRTDKDGSVTIDTDGISYSIEKENR